MERERERGLAQHTHAIATSAFCVPVIRMISKPLLRKCRKALPRHVPTYMISEAPRTRIARRAARASERSRSSRVDALAFYGVPRLRNENSFSYGPARFSLPFFSLVRPDRGQIDFGQNWRKVYATRCQGPCQNSLTGNALPLFNVYAIHESTGRLSISFEYACTDRSQSIGPRVAGRRISHVSIAARFTSSVPSPFPSFRFVYARMPARVFRLRSFVRSFAFSSHAP